MTRRFWEFLCVVAAVGVLGAASVRAQTCDDDNVCTNPDMCSNGTCTGTPIAASCDDHNPCTTNDTCADGSCHGTPVSGGSCDDLNPCTTADTCVSGTCQGTPSPGAACGEAPCEGTCTNIPLAGTFCLPDEMKQGMACTDSIGACTTDDKCVGVICLGKFKTCDTDANKCTIEPCNPENPDTCLAPIPLNCGDCGTCDGNTGQCMSANEGGSCNDGNVCTGNGTCQNGDCLAGAPVTPGEETPTDTPTVTLTDTPTFGAPTDTPTEGPSGTPSDTPTLALPTDTPTEGPSATPSDTEAPTGTPTDTPTGIPTGTASATATETPTGIPTGTASATVTATASETPTGIPTGTASATVTATATAVDTATATSTPPPTATVTNTQPTSTATASRTATSTNTPLPVVASIIVGSTTGEPGASVSFDVTLETEAQVAGVQNDIGFNGKAPIAAVDGKPDCTVNPAIDKPDTSFAFLPPGCTPGTDCAAVRAIVLSFNNLDPIPNNSVLYSCTVKLADDATGSYPLTCSNPGAGDPDQRLGADCTNGSVTVANPIEVTLVLGDVSGAAGDIVPFSVSLQTGVEVARTQNDTTFPSVAGVVADLDGNPSCAVDPEINKGDTTFVFLPTGCTVGTSCTGVRASVLALDNTDAIPNGAVLYTCQVAIATTAAAGTYPLTCSNAGSNDPNGGALVTQCIDSDLVVGVQPTQTFTSSPTLLPTPTFTPTQGTVGPTQTPTNTPPPPPTSTNTRKPKTPNEDDGCQIVGPGAASPEPWVLLLPLAGLLWLRRRGR